MTEGDRMRSGTIIAGILVALATAHPAWADDDDTGHQQSGESTDGAQFGEIPRTAPILPQLGRRPSAPETAAVSPSSRGAGGGGRRHNFEVAHTF